MYLSAAEDDDARQVVVMFSVERSLNEEIMHTIGFGTLIFGKRVDHNLYSINPKKPINISPTLQSSKFCVSMLGPLLISNSTGYAELWAKLKEKMSTTTPQSSIFEGLTPSLDPKRKFYGISPSPRSLYYWTA